MQFKHLLMAVAVSSVLSPGAMAKSAGGLHIKNVPVKMRAAGKAKKSEKIAVNKSTKRSRKGTKRTPREKMSPEI